MNVVLLTGSARPNSASNAIVPMIETVASTKGISLKVVSAAELHLPFYDAPMPPSAPDFATTNSSVVAWSDIVKAADAVVLLTPEYNGGPSAVQKNAIDWLYTPWNNKPVVMIGYGWYEPSRAHQSLSVALDVIKARQGTHVQLQFGHEIEMDGRVKDSDAATAKIDRALSSLAV